MANESTEALKPPVADTVPSVEVADSAVTEQPQENSTNEPSSSETAEKIRLGGREFDSWEAADSWAIKLAQTVGRQGNELGALRSQLRQVQEQPAVAQVPELKEEDVLAEAEQTLFSEPKKALKTVLDYATRKAQATVDQRDAQRAQADLAREHNRKFWDEYTNRAEDIVDHFGLDLVQTQTNTFGEDFYRLDKQGQFEYLDSFFGNRIKSKGTEKVTKLPSKRSITAPSKAGSGAQAAIEANKQASTKASEQPKSALDILRKNSSVHKPAL